LGVEIGGWYEVAVIDWKLLLVVDGGGDGEVGFSSEVL
jgi:hypothetical protein